MRDKTVQICRLCGSENFVHSGEVNGKCIFAQLFLGFAEHFSVISCDINICSHCSHFYDKMKLQ